jgi:tetratricopeptide (TPR) repeat protein
MKIFIRILFFLLINIKVNAQTPHNQPDTLKKYHDLMLQGMNASIQKDGWLSAYNYFTQAYQVAQEAERAVEMAEALRQIAKIEATAAQRKDQALQYFMQELKLRQKIDNKIEIANSYENIGDFFRKNLNDFEEAIGYYRQALLLQQKYAPDFKTRERLLLKVANTYTSMENPRQALPFYLEALHFIKNTHRFEQASELSMDIAQLFALEHRYDSAIHYAQSAKTFYEKGRVKKRTQNFDFYIASLENMRDTARIEHDRKIYWQRLAWGIVPLLIIALMVVLVMKRKKVL